MALEIRPFGTTMILTDTEKLAFFELKQPLITIGPKILSIMLYPTKRTICKLPNFLKKPTFKQKLRSMDIRFSKASPWADAFTSEFGTVKNVKIYTEPKCWAGQKSVPSITAAPKCKVKKIHS